MEAVGSSRIQYLTQIVYPTLFGRMPREIHRPVLCSSHRKRHSGKGFGSSHVEYAQSRERQRRKDESNSVGGHKTRILHSLNRKEIRDDPMVSGDECRDF